MGGSTCPAGGQHATLTIEAGVEVRFAVNGLLDVNGRLVARGTVTAPILFTSNKVPKAPGDWNGIRFRDGAQDATFDAGGTYTGGSIMEFCVAEFAKDAAGLGVLALESATPFLHQVTVRNCTAATGAAMIGVEASENFKINGCRVSSNAGIGVSIVDSHGTVVGTSSTSLPSRSK